jgi:hypothetical protein
LRYNLTVPLAVEKLHKNENQGNKKITQTRACHNNATNILIDDMKRRDACPSRIAVIKIIEPLSSRPIPYTTRQVNGRTKAPQDGDVPNHIRLIGYHEVLVVRVERHGKGLHAGMKRSYRSIPSARFYMVTSKGDYIIEKRDTHAKRPPATAFQQSLARYVVAAKLDSYIEHCQVHQLQLAS